MNELEGKLCKLKDILAGIGSVLIAYSGGADSTFLLKVALDVLGENVLAATTRAPIFPSSELTAAEEMAHRLEPGTFSSRRACWTTLASPATRPTDAIFVSGRFSQG